jgi:hypothetical protein
MTSYIDKYPELSPVVDVGGDMYYLGSEIPIEYVYKSRKDFLTTFGNDPATEVVLRKYMFQGYNYKKIPFDSDEEKEILMSILKRRLRQLKDNANEKISSSILKNSYIQRTYINLDIIIKYLEGADIYQPVQFEKLKEIGTAITSPREYFVRRKRIKYIKSLSDDQLADIVLEIIWYLTNLDNVPSKIRGDYLAVITDIGKLNLVDLVGTFRDKDRLTNRIKDVLMAAKGERAGAPVDLGDNDNNNGYVPGSAAAAATGYYPAAAAATGYYRPRSSSFDSNNGSVSGGGNDKKNELLNNIIKLNYVFKLKKIIGNITFNKLIKSSQSGGANQEDNDEGDEDDGTTWNGKSNSSIIERTISPYFHYFEIIYGELYDFLNTVIQNYENLETINFDNMIHLYFIMSNINPTSNNANEDGIYKLRNASDDVYDFITYLSQKIVNNTDTRIQEIIEILPKVRVASFVKDSADEVPYIGLFINPYNIKSRSDGVGASSNKNSGEQFIATRDDIFLICSKDDSLTLLPGNTTNFFSLSVRDVNMKSTTGLGVKKENISVAADLNSMYYIKTKQCVTLPMMPLIIMLLYKNIKMI